MAEKLATSCQEGLLKHMPGEEDDCNGGVAENGTGIWLCRTYDMVVGDSCEE